MIPRVILHNGASLDGRMDWGMGDIGLYYELAARWQADAMLSGSNTMLAAYSGQAVPDEGQFSEEDKPGALLEEGDDRSLLIVVDSRGRINNWRQIRQEPYWKDVLVLCSHSTPKDYLAGLQRKGVPFLIVGEDQVDFRKGLEAVNDRYGVKTVRVDSGGVLNGILLRACLVDEVSLIVNPCLVGGISPSSIFTAPDLTDHKGVILLQLIHFEKLRGDAVWLRYEVIR